MLNTTLLVVLLVQMGAATVTGILAERWFGSLGVTIASIATLAVLMRITAETDWSQVFVRRPRATRSASQ